MKIFTDGGSRGNPGESAVGVVVYDERGEIIWEKGKAIGVGTNNEAEYKAVLLALEWVKKKVGSGKSQEMTISQAGFDSRSEFSGSLKGTPDNAPLATNKKVLSTAQRLTQSSSLDFPSNISFYLDSKLVVEQLSKKWKIKEPRMQELAARAWAMMEEMKLKVSFTHIPREKNKRADMLVNAALDAKML